MKTIISVMIILLGVLVNCTPEAGIPTPTPLLPPTPITPLPTATPIMPEVVIPFTAVNHGKFGIVAGEHDESPLLIVIDEKVDLSTLEEWVRPELKENLNSVDYTINAGVLVFQGVQSNSNDVSVQIEAVRQQEETVSIYAIFQTPEAMISDDGEITIVKDGLFSSPYSLIQIPKKDLDIESTLFRLIVNERTVAVYPPGSAPVLPVKSSWPYAYP